MWYLHKGVFHTNDRNLVKCKLAWVQISGCYVIIARQSNTYPFHADLPVVYN
jgi:hypothetical protein